MIRPASDVAVYLRREPVDMRKNWLFSQTPRGAQASATIYSVIETAKINGLESYAYLLEVLKSLPASGQR